MSGKPRSGKSLVGLGAGLGLVGLLLFAVVAFVGVRQASDRIKNWPRTGVAAPAHPVSFPRSGGFTVYYEAPTQAAARAPAPGFEAVAASVRVTPAGGGPPLPLAPYDSEETYTRSGFDGAAVATISIPAEGVYQFEATPGAGLAPGSRFAVGEGFGRQAARAVLGAILLLLVFGGVGVVVFVVGVVKLVRARSAKDALDAVAPAGASSARGAPPNAPPVGPPPPGWRPAPRAAPAAGSPSPSEPWSPSPEATPGAAPGQRGEPTRQSPAVAPASSKPAESAPPPWPPPPDQHEAKPPAPEPPR